MSSEQPTGSTEVEVGAESKAEVQEDAAEQAELSLVDQILALQPLLNKIATL